MDKTALEELKQIKEKSKPKHRWNPVKELQQRFFSCYSFHYFDLTAWLFLGI